MFNTMGADEDGDDDVVNVPAPKLTYNSNEDIVRLRVEGCGIEDDNELATDNMLAEATNQTGSGCVAWEEWGGRQVYNRFTDGYWHEYPKMAKDMEGSRYIDYFMYFLPTEFMKNIVVTETNKEMSIVDGGAFSWGDSCNFLRFDF